MCSVPVIFFSVIACFAAGNADLTQMKRLGVRLFSMFELLHIISALVGIGAVWLFSTGRGANLTAASANIALSVPAAQSSLSALSSLRDVFINAVPGNLLKPFLEDNILQLMILGILTGIAANAAGAKTFTLLADDLGKIFAKIVSYILRFTVLIVFCSVASAIITAGLQTLLSVIAILFTMAAAFLALNLVLCVMIAVLAHLNPLKFYKKSAHVFMVGFSIASSNAVMPDAMQSLEDMGVSPKVYSFAIPFGMALSKLINPMYMFVSILSVANMYGIDIKFETLLSMFFSIVFIIPMLPGIPGMMLSMMSSFFALAGCPVEGVAFIMAIDTIAGMIIKTQGNVLGVTEPALIAARQENLLDVEKYNS